MALPLYAFTTLDGEHWALVARSAVEEDQSALESRAQHVIYSVASVGPTGLWVKLAKHLRVAPLATVMKEPYWQFRDTPFDEAWLQAQYTLMVRRTYTLNPDGWDLD